EVQRLSAPGLRRRIQRRDDRGGGDPQGPLDRDGQARRGDAGARRRDSVRQGHVPRARSSVDDGRVRRPHRDERRQGRDGRLEVRQRRRLSALRRLGARASAGGLTLSTLLIQLVNGLAGASALFLVAAGLTLIFGVTRIVNFAHGSLYMLGAYIAYS